MAETAFDINGGDNDYSDLIAFDAAQAGAIASGDQVAANVFGTIINTTSAVLSGWSSADSTARLIIRADSSAVHTGTPGTGARLLTATAGAYPLQIDAGSGAAPLLYCDVEDLEVDISADSTTYGIYLTEVGKQVEFVVNRCLMYTTTGETTARHIRFFSSSNASSKLYIRNTVCIDGAIHFYGNSSKNITEVQFCTSYGAGSIGSINTRNSNVFVADAVSAFVNVDTTNDYNISNDASAPGTNVLINKTIYGDYFTDHVNDDFSLKGTTADGGIFGATGLAGTPISGITTDILGNTRDASTPDIGAFELFTVSPPTTTNAALTDTTPTRGDSITLTADATSDNTITKMEYFIGVDPGEDAGIDLTLTPSSGTSVSGSIVIDTTLIFSGVHTISVRSYDATAGWGAVDTINMTISIAAPTNVTATGGDTTVLLDWDAVAFTPITYYIQWGTTTGVYPNNLLVAGPNPPTEQIHVGRTNGVEYFYQVRAADPEGNGAWSAEASAFAGAPGGKKTKIIGAGINGKFIGG